MGNITNNTIQVSDVEPSVYDYNKTIAELEQFYDDLNNKIKNGDKSYLTGELMQLGYALDFVSFVKDNRGIEFGFKEEDIPVFENMLDSLSRAVMNKVFSQDDVTNIIKQATGFFSVMVWKNLGGGFINSNLGYGINVNGTNIFLYNRIGRRLYGDKNADMISFYQDIKKLI